MECAICYADVGSACRKLCCGHEFCGSCIKQWYLKGTGAGCPMCRRPIYFQGFHKVRDVWDEEHWRQKCIEVIDEYRTTRIEEAFEIRGVFGPIWDAFITRDLMADLRDLDRTARFLMDEGLDADWLEYVLFETDDYYSDRSVGKGWRGEGWPVVKEPATRYPMII